MQNKTNAVTNMIRKHTLQQALIAACLVSAATASAQFSGANSLSDLYLAVRGTSSDMIVDLGARSLYTTTASLTAGGYDPALVSGLGTIQGWTVFGYNNSSYKELWEASPSGVSQAKVGFQGTVSGNMGGIVAGAASYGGSIAAGANNTTTAIIVPNTDPSSYTALAGVAGNFGGNQTFGVENTVPGDSTLYYIPALTPAGTHYAAPHDVISTLGTFTFNGTDGTLAFAGAQAVPEPSTYAFLGLGAVMMLVSRLARVFRKS